LFIDAGFATKTIKTLGLETRDDFEPAPVGGFDGTKLQEIGLAVKAHFRVQNHYLMNEWFLITHLPHHDIIVGKKWFAKHDVLPDCRRNRLLFPDGWLPDYYDTDIAMDQEGHKLDDPEYQRDADRRNKLIQEDEKLDQRRRLNYTKPRIPVFTAKEQQLIDQRIAELSGQECRQNTPEAPVKQVRFELPPSVSQFMKRSVENQSPELLKMERQLGNIPPPPKPKESMPPMAKVAVADPTYDSTDSQGPYRLIREPLGWVKDRPFDCAIIGAISFMVLAKRNGSQPGVTSLHELDRYIQDKRRERESPLLDGDELKKKIRDVVPDAYRDYEDVFSKVASDEIAPYRPGVDHKIDIGDHQPEELGYSPLYKMSLEEAEACKKYIVDNLHKGFIESSNAPWAAPVLFAPKPGGRGLRFCVDYRKLNALTRKDRYPLPLIDETMSRIAQAKIFTKIDIRQAFHRIRMQPDSEELTTFRTRYGAYKFKVLPFGLTNGPATFQRYINDVLMGYLDEFCSAYIDDILIYSDNLEEHKIHVRRVLDRLRKAGLQADIDKCEFHVTKTKFLGFVIGSDGIAVDPEKVEAVSKWKQPESVRGVQSFLGFCNFYRRFVERYSLIAKPLTNLTKKEVPFKWTEECQHAFDTLKYRLLHAPVLAHFQYDRETRLETDSSDGVVAGVLNQKAENGEWHPVGYFSETMLPAECNYPIHDKELLAVVRALRFWRSELVGLQQDHPFTVVTDHEALEYFSQKRLLNIRQAGWAEQMAQYHFVITYRPGSQNAGADALTRKPEDLKTQKARKEAHRTMRVFKPDGTPETTVTETGCLMVLDSPEVPEQTGLELTDDILTANKVDPELEVMREKARLGTDPHFTLTAGHLLLYDGRLVVPEAGNLRTKIIREIHSRLTGGHPGRNKTRRMVTSRYWWPGVGVWSDRFVANCDCAAAKAPRHKTPGLLHPLPIPHRSWRHLVVDFNKMPLDRSGMDNCFVMIDRLSKTSWTTPCKSTATAKDAARMYYEGPYRIFGLPESVVSDRGGQFVSDLMDEMSLILGVRWKLSSPGHSQTAGQVENLNQWINQRLRIYANHYQDNWSKFIPALDFVQNGTPHDSTGLEPHEVTMGFPMPQQWEWQNRTTDFSDMDVKEKLNRQEGQRIAEQIQGAVEIARQNMGAAQQRQVTQANKTRVEPNFDVGDEVRVIRKTWSERTDRPSDKLDLWLTRGHYPIKEMSGHSYVLELPDSWQGPRLFHASRLVKYPNNPLPGQAAENPAGESVGGEEEWEVQEVTASRLRYGKLYYKVQWKGWDPDPTWYKAEDLRNAPLKLEEYHTKNPDKAGPPLRLQQWKKAAEEDRFCEPHKDDNKPAPLSGKTKIRQSRIRK
jgi:transposase InsO family protein